MVEDLKEILEKQKTSKGRVVGLPSFNFNIYYNENKKESLLSHCIHITKDIQEYFLKHYILTLEIVYNIDYKKDLEDYVKYKEMSLELFKTAFEIKEKKWNFSLSAFTPKSKYEKLAKDVLDNFKYQGLDVEYTFIGDPKTYKSNTEIQRPETVPTKKPNVVSDNTIQGITTTKFAKKDSISNQEETTVAIDKKEFKFETEDNFAWLTKYEEEVAMIELMRKSSQAKISATSAKGSKTIDTFSLSGFSDAYEAAKKKCNFI
jgi:hypothetical protein